MSTEQANPTRDDALTRDVIDALAVLDPEGKREVLAFSRELVRRRRAASPGGALLAFAGAFLREDLERMDQAIADAREAVDPASW